MNRFFRDTWPLIVIALVGGGLMLALRWGQP